MKFSFEKLRDYFIKPAKFGTVSGVFVPDVLTILGVILYLRLGWVVGNAGLLGAIVIILLAKSVTVATGLSMSSITTNIKIGAGGAYSIIAKSLGLEAGGSVGIPFYFSQTLSVALYIIGFTEGWLAFFPDHPASLIAGLTALAILGISFVSANFAIKFQYIILAIIILSLISFLSSDHAVHPHWKLIGNFEDGDFWEVFAVFFPAVTGIMAGANLSGDLKDPRRAIPRGTMTAIGITLVIYIGLAVFMAFRFDSEELRTNYHIMVDAAKWSGIVVMGILAATFSSGLGSMVGAPRILQALAEHETVPFSRFFAKKTADGEPKNAILFTGIIVVIALITGNLNALATLITMFFLITYGMLNLVVFMQQAMRIISFRPTFKVPIFVPLYGAVASIFMMFLINPVFSMIALLTIIALYIWLAKKGISAEWGDIRGGFFLALAEKASNIAARFPRHTVSWKPDFVLPVEEPEKLKKSLLFIRSMVAPSGSIFAFTVREKQDKEIQEKLREMLSPLEAENILVNSTVIEDSTFLHGAKIVLQTLQGGAFRPNTLMLNLGDNKEKDYVIEELSNCAVNNQMGLIILRQHLYMAFGMHQTINVWLRDKSPNWHLALLIALQLQANWNGKLNLITVADKSEMIELLYNFLNKLGDQARLPANTEFFVLEGKFSEALSKAPAADINLFGLADALNFDFMRSAVERTNSSALFIRDSGYESAFA